MTAQQIARILLAIDPQDVNGEQENQLEARLQALEQKIQGVIPPLKAITDLAAELAQLQTRIADVEQSCLSQLKKFENGILWIQTEIKAIKQKKDDLTPKIAHLQAQIDEFKQQTDIYKMKIDARVKALTETADLTATRLKDHLNPGIINLAERVGKFEDTRHLCDARSKDTGRQLNVLAKKILDLENRGNRKTRGPLQFHHLKPNPGGNHDFS